MLLNLDNAKSHVDDGEHAVQTWTLTEDRSKEHETGEQPRVDRQSSRTLGNSPASLE